MDIINNIFANTVAQHNKSSQFFEHLYYIKRYMYMLENIHGESTLQSTPAKINHYQTIITRLCSFTELFQFTTLFENTLRESIPDDKLEEWDNSDYSLFTDKYHCKEYWNQFPNHPIINLLIEQLCYLHNTTKPYTIYTDEPQNKSDLWLIRLYDFNDMELYFNTSYELQLFTNEYELAPYTVFSKHNNIWTEEYSE